MASHLLYRSRRNPGTNDPATPDLRSKRGQAIVELLIAIPVLALLLFGIIEMGAAWRTSHVVTQAAREGSRLAALPSATEDQVRAAINDRLASGGLAPGDASISFTCPSGCFAQTRPSGVRVETRVTYPVQFVLLAPIVDYFSGNGDNYQQQTLQSVFVMRTE